MTIIKRLTWALLSHALSFIKIDSTLVVISPLPSAFGHSAKPPGPARYLHCLLVTAQAGLALRGSSAAWWGSYCVVSLCCEMFRQRLFLKVLALASITEPFTVWVVPRLDTVNTTSIVTGTPLVSHELNPLCDEWRVYPSSCSWLSCYSLVAILSSVKVNCRVFISFFFYK